MLKKNVTLGKDELFANYPISELDRIISDTIGSSNPFALNLKSLNGKAKVIATALLCGKTICNEGGESTGADYQINRLSAAVYTLKTDLSKNIFLPIIEIPSEQDATGRKKIAVYALPKEIINEIRNSPEKIIEQGQTKAYISREKGVNNAVERLKNMYEDDATALMRVASQLVLGKGQSHLSVDVKMDAIESYARPLIELIERQKIE